jgi:hypothetical protein
MQFTCTLWRFPSSQNEIASRAGGSTSAEPAVAIPNLGAGFLKLLTVARGPPLRRAGALPAAAPRAPGPLVGAGAGAGNWGFRLLGAGAGRGWMARRGGREAAAAALDPPGSAAFSSPPVEGPAQERRGPPPTRNPLITILLRDTGRKKKKKILRHFVKREAASE